MARTAQVELIVGITILGMEPKFKAQTLPSEVNRNSSVGIFFFWAQAV
jgi:hypothetical protein